MSMLLVCAKQKCTVKSRLWKLSKLKSILAPSKPVYIKQGLPFSQTYPTYERRCTSHKGRPAPPKKDARAVGNKRLKKRTTADNAMNPSLIDLFRVYNARIRTNVGVQANIRLCNRGNKECSLKRAARTARKVVQQCVQSAIRVFPTTPESSGRS